MVVKLHYVFQDMVSTFSLSITSLYEIFALLVLSCVIGIQSIAHQMIGVNTYMQSMWGLNILNGRIYNAKALSK